MCNLSETRVPIREYDPKSLLHRIISAHLTPRHASQQIHHIRWCHEPLEPRAAHRQSNRQLWINPLTIDRLAHTANRDQRLP